MSNKNVLIIKGVCNTVPVKHSMSGFLWQTKWQTDNKQSFWNCDLCSCWLLPQTDTEPPQSMNQTTIHWPVCFRWVIVHINWTQRHPVVCKKGSLSQKTPQMICWCELSHVRVTPPKHHSQRTRSSDTTSRCQHGMSQQGLSVMCCIPFVCHINNVRLLSILTSIKLEKRKNIKI